MVRSTILVVRLLFAFGPGFGQPFTGKVAKVRNGDTIQLLRGGQTLTVQPHGIDAPEPSQPFGRRATEFLRRQIENDRVGNRVRDRDRCGRLGSTVLQNGTEVNSRLLRVGLAWYYWWHVDYTQDGQRVQTREYRAQQADRGLWRQPIPIPPWEWRDEAWGGFDGRQRTGGSSV